MADSKEGRGDRDGMTFGTLQRNVLLQAARRTRRYRHYSDG